MTSDCSVDTCERSAIARGLCGMHWARWRKGKSLTEKSDKEMTLSERFWSRVDKRSDDKCWLWAGSTRGNGKFQYGTIHNGRNTISAHRASYAMKHGAIPDLSEADIRGTCIRHTCDNTLCVNPNHLIPGTHTDNMRDKVDRNRTARSKTHCRHGHERTPENIYQSKAGEWHCRVCHKLRQSAANKLKREQRLF